MRMTPEEYDRIIVQQQKKMEAPQKKGAEYAADPGLESVLSRKIRGYAKDHGYPSLILPQTPLVKKIIPKGWPDGVMALPKGRVIFLELKNKDGSLKEDQVKYQLKLMALGHEWYVVRSFRQFLDIVEGI